MSILKSTNSGLNAKLTPSLITTLGWRKIEDENHTFIIRYFWEKDPNLRIVYRVDEGMFVHTILASKSLIGLSYDEPLHIRTIADLHKLQEYRMTTNMEKLIQLETEMFHDLHIGVMNDVAKDMTKEISSAIDKRIVERIRRDGTKVRTTMKIKSYGYNNEHFKEYKYR